MPYAYGTRAGITLIDLDATLPLLRRAANVVRGIAGAGGSVVFVGSRPELRPIVKRAAGRLGPQGFHVGYRWLPGTLTNRFAFFSQDENEAYELVPDSSFAVRLDDGPALPFRGADSEAAWLSRVSLA